MSAAAFTMCLGMLAYLITAAVRVTRLERRVRRLEREAYGRNRDLRP